MKTKNLRTLAIVGTLLFGVTSATSSYIHEVDGTISICDPDSSGTKCITMQDRNFGATTNDINSTGSYGYHYQRGNNYGFANPGVKGKDAITQAATGTLALWSPDDYNHVGYYGTTFIKGRSSSKYDYWSDNTPSNHNGLRGGENDTQENNYGYDETNNVARNVENRRGPCDAGYHVPSIGEWNQVLKYWAQENGIELEDYEGLKYNYTTIDSLKFQEDFKIPFAGYRHLDAEVYGVGGYANLWSSSPRAGNENSRSFRLAPNGASADYYGSRAYADSVRCFKDSYLRFPNNESGDSGSGSASTHVTLTLTAGSNTCTLNDYNLGTHDASAEEQYVESSGQDIVCEFLQNTGVIVLLSMGNLTDGTKVIGAENFTGVVTAIGNSLGSISNLIGGNYNLSGSQEIYWKAENTLGKWTGDLQIIGTIPAGTPSGTYTGHLEIVIQEGIGKK